MKISLINGSPKVTNSASQTLLDDLARNLADQAEIKMVAAHSPVLSQDIIRQLEAADAWVFALPLYIDGIPGHLLSCLVQLDKEIINPKRHVYGIVNCGFYEGIHARLALDILHNWCLKTGAIWGGGIGVGGGGGLMMLPNLAPGQGPKAPLDKALADLADQILEREVQENNYICLALPRALYKMQAQMSWRRMIKANGAKAKDLGHIPR